MTCETLPQTFRAAVACLVDFSDRFEQDRATATEIEDADITLIGLRRLLADWRVKHSEAEA